MTDLRLVGDGGVDDLALRDNCCHEHKQLPSVAALRTDGVATCWSGVVLHQLRKIEALRFGFAVIFAHRSYMK